MHRCCNSSFIPTSPRDLVPPFKFNIEPSGSRIKGDHYQQQSCRTCSNDNISLFGRHAAPRYNCIKSKYFYGICFCMSSRQGLRERKKEATRRAISDVATSLFIERGFDNVTVADIAEVANVSRMTVFNYFPRKEDLFFDREDESRELVQDALAKRSAGEPPIMALHKLIKILVGQQHPFANFSDGVVKFWRTVEQSPALAARAREMRDELVNDLATQLAQTVGLPPSDPSARLAAAMLFAALYVAYAEALRQRRSRGSVGSTSKAFLKMIERGFAGVTVALHDTPYVQEKPARKINH
jgi:AcrR family transcriptional regulator